MRSPITPVWQATELLGRLAILDGISKGLDKLRGRDRYAQLYKEVHEHQLQGQDLGQYHFLHCSMHWGKRLPEPSESSITEPSGSVCTSSHSSGVDLFDLSWMEPCGNGRFGPSPYIDLISLVVGQKEPGASRRRREFECLAGETLWTHRPVPEIP